ncbi:DUF5666 domain-containing protein [Azospirillum sp. sgz301742]
MSRRRLIGLLAGALLAACGADVTNRTADRGIGGTGIRSADRGIGGTGIRTADRGIGGTGIVGTVTAFGSIWVNGLEVALPPSAAVRIEGHPVPASAVQLGHVVAVTAGPADAGMDFSAATVEVRYAVAGPVETARDGVLTVLGQRVESGGALLAVEPRPGVWVAVSGLRRPDGSIAAGRIEPWDAARGWLLRGSAGPSAPGTLALPGLTARLAPGVAAPEPGQSVRAAGRLGSDGVFATEAAPDPLNPFGAAIRALSVEVFVDTAGRPVAGGAALAAPIAKSGRIVVEGAVDSLGVLSPGRSASAPGIGTTAAPGLGGPPGAGRAAAPATGPALGPAPGAAAPGAAPGAALGAASGAGRPGGMGGMGGAGRGGPGGGGRGR